MDYSKLSDKDLIALSNNDYASMSDEGLKYLSEDTGEVKKNKGIDLTPSGLYKGGIVNLLAPIRAAVQGEDIETARRNGAKALENFKPAKGAGDFLVDMAVYSKLPMLKTASGANKLAKAGTFLGNAAIQGGLPGAVESLKRDGNAIEGGGLGTGIAAALQTIPYVGKGLSKAGNKAVQLTGRFGQIKPETLEQVIKPESQALEMTSDDASNLLLDTTRQIRENFDKLRHARGAEVDKAVAALPNDAPRFNVNDLLGDIKGTFDQYQLDLANPARTLAGGLENDLNSLVNSVTKNPAEVYKLNPENKLPLGYLKDKENEAFEILSQATGKPVNWLKSQLNSNSFGNGVGKRKEFIESLARESDDKIADLGNGYFDRFQYYKPNDLSDLNAGQELVNRAFDDVANRNFNVATDDLTRDLNRASNRYDEIVNALAKDSRNENAYEKAFTDLNEAIKGLPEGAQNELMGKLSTAADDIYNMSNTVSPLSLQGIKKVIGNLGKWGDEVSRGYAEPVTEQVYGKFAERLNNLSPEIKAANKAFSDLMKFKKNDTVAQILKGDLMNGDKLGGAPSALKSYKSSVNKGSGANNLKDLEDLLVKEAGQERFLNKIDDINAAMDLLKTETTGLGGAAGLIKALLTRPVLSAVRGANRMEIPQKLNNINEMLKPLGRLMPGLGGKAAANMLYGGVEYNDYQ